MEFRIADTFTDSLARLTGDEQKAAKTTAFDLQLHPANPGLQFHKLDKPKDPNFFSVRANKDIRLIVHKTGNSLLLCYVDHHDRAYQWAERRKLATHPRTGAAQFVEVRERVQEIIVPHYTQAMPAVASKPLFASISDERLLRYGVPPEWMNDVRQVTEEDALLTLAEHLPGEAAEALLVLATDRTPEPEPLRPRSYVVDLQAVEREKVSSAEAEATLTFSSPPDPFSHPDAKRRFRVIQNLEELERALEYPWEKWTVFLHPSQREWAERDYSGPARVSGSAGTGKTVVALHRAAFLARRNPEARVLLTTFSEPLANALRTKLRRLIYNEPRLAERVDVWSFDGIARRLFKGHRAHPRIVSQEKLRKLLSEASAEVGNHKFSLRFIMGEWEEVVDAWQLETWESYRDVRRLGRKTRLPEQQRAVLWSIFDDVRKKLIAENLVTHSGFLRLLTASVTETRTPIFDHVIVDEAQDLGIPHLRFFAALGGNRPNGLFFAGDLGQRIFQQPFSWRALGVDVRGRSRTLRVNYRTSHQIRSKADRLLGLEVSDVDGNSEDRRGTVSVFNGPQPVISVCSDQQEEVRRVGDWLSDLESKGVLPHECAVFVRSEGELERARSAVDASGLASTVLDKNVEIQNGRVSIGTMHLAKGLEFRAVAIMACDDEIIPLQTRIENIGDESELEEIYNTERHLLYVACTRARDYLLVCSGGAPSEFLNDLYV
jgi:hypothetical protein